MTKVTVKKSPKPPKRVINVIHNSDENLPTESQNDELMLKQYMNLNEPSPKRFREDIDNDDQSADTEETGVDDEPSKEETTPNRNPFKKTVFSKDPLLSPTRISCETNSLVKNQSPVKHIDYNKLAKLSKFKRTLIAPKEQPILSHFFSASTKPKSENVEETVVKTEVLLSPDVTGNVVQPSNPMKSPNLLDSYTNSPKASLYFNKSSDSGISTNTEQIVQENPRDELIKNDPEDDLNHQSQCLILDKFKFALKEKIDDEQEPMECQSSQSTYTSEKTDNSDSNGLLIVLSDDENETDNSRKDSISRMWLNGSQKSKLVSVNG